MERIEPVVCGKVRTAYRIWIAPLVLYFFVVVLSGLAFQFAISKWGVDDKRIDELGTILAYEISGCLLITCWIIIKRFEKIRQRRLPKIVKTSFRIFLTIYLISLLLTLILKVLLYLVV